MNLIDGQFSIDKRNDMISIGYKKEGCMSEVTMSIEDMIRLLKMEHIIDCEDMKRCDQQHFHINRNEAMTKLSS